MAYLFFLDARVGVNIIKQKDPPGISQQDTCLQSIGVLSFQLNFHSISMEECLVNNQISCFNIVLVGPIPLETNVFDK